MKTLLVGLGIEYTYGRVLLSGILEGARNMSGLRVRLARSRVEMERVLEGGGDRFDAAIGMIWTSAETDCIRQRCDRVVSFANTEERVADLHVTVDDRAVGAMAARELMETGLESAAVYQPECHRHGLERMAGFLETWAAARSEQVPVFGNFDQAARLLKGSETPFGIFATNDVRARELVEWCETRAVSVPEQISILGVDDDEVYVHLGRHLLSSVQLPFRALGEEAVRLAFSPNFPRPSPCRLGPLGVVHRETTTAVGRYPPVLRNFLNQIRRSSPLPASVAEACSLWKLPRRTLELTCRGNVNKSPGVVLREEREKRVRRLQAAGLSSKEISYELGYVQTRSVRKLL